jgi:hypothetical protein
LAIIAFFFVSAGFSPSLVRGNDNAARAAAAPQSTPLTPTETAKFVYKALYEKRFRDAFNLSVFKLAIEGLSDADFNELRPEFEAMAAESDKIEFTGEQISGEHATVYARVVDDKGNPIVSPIPFIRRNGTWIFGDDDTLTAVQKDGKNYFLNIRIQTHEADAKVMFERIVKAQIVHASKNGGAFADIRTLVAEELLPEDILGTQSTGYKYSVNVAKDGKTYTAAAEPERYGRSGKLSFYLENSILNSKDNGGKPLKN